MHGNGGVLYGICDTFGSIHGKSWVCYVAMMYHIIVSNLLGDLYQSCVQCNLLFSPLATVHCNHCIIEWVYIHLYMSILYM